MTELTDRQLEVLRAIHQAIETHGSPPTIRELGVTLDISSTNGIAEHLRALEKKGHIERDDQQARRMRITKRGLQALGLFRTLAVQQTAQPQLLRCPNCRCVLEVPPAPTSKAVPPAAQMEKQ